MFQVGQQVVCVKSDRFGILERGRIYTVEKVVKGWDGRRRNQYGITVCEIDVPQPYAGFVRRRFRPVRKTDISVFQSLLAHAPKRKRAALTATERG